jgi:hexosaminidase
VRIVPEFDIPGHATAWFAAYPQYASAPGPYEVGREPRFKSGTFDPTREATYVFLNGFLAEMTRLFPDAYFHIGGDEVDPKDWNDNARIRRFMQRHQMANAGALQGYFNRRLQRLLAKYHKHIMGWDEILRPDIPKTIVIQSWRGQKSLAQAAREGYDGILSAGWYLDLMQTAAQHYAVDPLKGETAGLTAEQASHILGGEAAMWEELATAENIDAKLWPRMAAIAERLWSPASVTDIDSMYARLDLISTWLEWLGLRHRSGLELMRRRLVPRADLPALDMLASIVEPIKNYKRHSGHRYSSRSSFNRLVDAIAPESDEARGFNTRVARYLAGDATQAATMEASLNTWLANAPRVAALAHDNAVVSELGAVAAKSATLARAGLDALAALRAKQSVDAGTVAEKLAEVDEAAKPEAELLIQIAPGVRKLVAALQVR